MYIYKRTVLFIIIIIISGCATPLKSVKNSNFYDGEVTIFRESSFIGGGANLHISINGEEYKLSPIGIAKVILPAGMHSIKKTRGTDLLGFQFNLISNWEMNFRVNPGEMIRIGSSFNGEFDFNRYDLNGQLINKAPLYAGSTSSPKSAVAQALPPVAQATRQADPPRSSLALSLTTSQPNADGVVTINITTNSDTASLKINGEEAGGRADGRYSVNRFAKLGSNSFEVIATDRYGITSRQTVVVNREVQVVAERTRYLNPTLINAAKPRDAVAVIIGIEKYKRVPDADFANNDASAFYDYARRALGIKPENIRLLVDDKADAAEILRSFKTWLPTRVNKNTTDVYVFYSGHGLPSEDGGSLYFLPHEVDRDLLERTAITQKEVVQAIQRTTPKSVTMFIDSCYSGQSRTGTSLLASARPISIAPKASTDFPPNFMVISASAPDQISSSSPELKHGIFSYYLMLGMEGEADGNKDGQITVGEMQTYLSQQVTRRAIGMNRTQSPQTTGDLSRVLVQASGKTR
jgi:hypothetical protein